MYFNSEDIPQSSLDIDQYKKVLDFKLKVSAKGGLYKEYSGANNFSKLLQEHLTTFCLQQFSDRSANKTDDNRIADSAYTSTVTKILESKLDRALSHFGDEKNVWLDPILSTRSNITEKTEENFQNRFDINKLLKSPSSLNIKAPPQFGLTCLARYLVLEAWKAGNIWIYLDFRKLDLNQLSSTVRRKLSLLNQTGENISCIVLDSWKSNLPNSKKVLKRLVQEFPNVPIIVMQTINDITFREEEPDEEIDRDFCNLHLLALPRTQIRKVVSEYNANKFLGDENLVLEKVLNDLETLNIHRTAINCITLLKVSEFKFDSGPTNRTEMIEKVLFVLFNMVKVPEHEAHPDLKDCEYILGKFCEDLIRRQKFEFSKNEFIDDLTLFCREKLLNLNVTLVFNILFENSIILNIRGVYVFRASFWIYYFAAKRMYADDQFKQFMLTDFNYAAYPEVIEFFAGIDRNRTEIINKVLTDLSQIREKVDTKVGLEQDFNPLNNATWNPKEEDLLEITDELKDDVSKSKLPDEVKDKYADLSYNQLKPYHQTVKKVFETYSFRQLFHQVSASSKALRNSDYVEPELKKALLEEIMKSWKLVSKILFVLAPFLAEKDSISFDGQGFRLAGDFGDTFEKKLSNIVQANPINVVEIFRYDLYSKKIGPLLFDFFNKEEDQLVRHQCACVLFIEKPPGWEKEIANYIVSLKKDSFYLYDLTGQLRNNYQYSFSTSNELAGLRKLIKLCIAKHQFGGRKPGLKEIARISNNVIPERVDE